MTDPTSPAAIGQRLKAIRKQLDLTQEEFARRAGESQNAYLQYEAGMRRPSLKIASALADTYGLSLDYIYRGLHSGLLPRSCKEPSPWPPTPQPFFTLRTRRLNGSKRPAPTRISSRIPIVPVVASWWACLLVAAQSVCVCCVLAQIGSITSV
jgi:transcriptional regulator with XRE-family HTH domain